MPNDVKAAVSAVTLVVAAVLAFWSGSPIRPELSIFVVIIAVLLAFWSGSPIRPELSIFVVIIAVFMVAAMWVFPEAGVKKGDVRKAK